MYQTKEKSRKYFFYVLLKIKKITHIENYHTKRWKKLKKQDRNVSTSLDYSNINYYKIYNKIYIIINTSKLASHTIQVWFFLLSISI